MNVAGPTIISVCINRREDPTRPSCHMRGSLQLLHALSAAFSPGVTCKPTICMGCCNHGPAAKLLLRGELQIVTDASFDKLKSILQGAG